MSVLERGGDIVDGTGTDNDDELVRIASNDRTDVFTRDVYCVERGGELHVKCRLEDMLSFYLFWCKVWKGEASFG